MQLLIAGELLPWADWAGEFRDAMPEEIKVLMEEVAAGTSEADHSKAIKDRLKSIRDLFRLTRYKPVKDGALTVAQDTAGGRPREADPTEKETQRLGRREGRPGGRIYALFATEDGNPARRSGPTPIRPSTGSASRTAPARAISWRIALRCWCSSSRVEASGEIVAEPGKQVPVPAGGQVGGSRTMSFCAGERQIPMRLEINGAELCVDTVGDPARPAVLLVMGAAGSMDRWEEPFCERLAAAGRFVIRYDHRDTGGSTSYQPGKPGYTGDDLVADALGVLNQLGVERAHFVGISMGGGIVQRIAVDHPARVLSITLMSTSPAGSGGSEYAELPPMSDELRALFSADGEQAEPDWSDREATIAFLLESERPYAGSRGLDEDAMRALLGRVYDRSTSLPSANNHFVLDGSDTARRRLAEITVPALVIHGADDPLLPPAHGEALAREIRDAKLLVIDGLGHEFPPSAWDDVLPALVALTR